MSRGFLVFINMLIVFEGIEGSGKSTQITLLSMWMSLQRIRYITTRQPGGTETGDDIREIILNNETLINGTTELLLFAADRANHVEKVIKPRLEDGVIVICDRFHHSTIAYQGYGRGMSLEVINTINDIATDGIKPDITFWLNCDIDLAFNRIRDRTADRIESEDIDFFKRVHQGYLEISKNDPSVVEIDANKSINHVSQQILDHYHSISGHSS